LIAVAGVADDAEDEDLPVGEARATFVFVYAGENFGFQKGEDLAHDFGVGVDVLQSEEDGGELVSAFGGDLDFFDGNDAELGLNLVVVTHGLNIQKTKASS
jgi:hypothetical protein